MHRNHNKNHCISAVGLVIKAESLEHCSAHILMEGEDNKYILKF